MVYLLIIQILMIIIWLYKIRHLSLLYRMFRPERKKMAVIKKCGFLLNRFLQSIKIIILISIAIGFFNWGTLNILSSATLYIRITGILFFLIGISLETSAARSLGKNYLKNIQIRQGQELVVTGPYRFIRHPMYLGEILVFTGFGLVLSSYLAIGLTILVYSPLLNYYARKEESLLLGYFGNSFREYRKRTRCFL